VAITFIASYVSLNISTVITSLPPRFTMSAHSAYMEHRPAYSDFDDITCNHIR
jgi:hypothetical protein